MDPRTFKSPEKEIALKIWHDSGRLVNPRHIRGTWYFVRNHKLINIDQNGNIEITNDGAVFLNDENSEVITRIDKYEGLLNVLQAVSEHNPEREVTYFLRILNFVIHIQIIEVNLYINHPSMIEWLTYSIEGLWKDVEISFFKSLIWV